VFDGIQFATETILLIIVLLQGSPGIHQDTSLFLPGVCLPIYLVQVLKANFAYLAGSSRQNGPHSQPICKVHSF